MVADAVFDGMCIDPSAEEIPELQPLLELYQQHNLKCMVNAFPGTADDMQPLLNFAKEFDACMVNVISDERPEQHLPV